MGTAMAEPRFFCDDHLRRLARWLRAAGYDTAWQAAIDDDDLLARAAAEERIVLTLDRALARRGGRDACLLPSHDPLAQLRYLKERYALDLKARAFTRCPVCNVELTAAQARDVEVPERVRALCDRFWRCPGCRRTYWQGDHVRHMRERFSGL
jgi:uncharacterized protein with PIN domain